MKKVKLLLLNLILVLGISISLASAYGYNPYIKTFSSNGLDTGDDSSNLSESIDQPDDHAYKQTLGGNGCMNCAACTAPCILRPE